MIEFLSGDDRPIKRELERQMREAAAEERFEDAARYRNRLRAVERLAERQAVERRSIGTIDVIGVAVWPERAAVQVFPLRDGRMVDRYSFHLENAAGEELGEVLEQFCLEYYGSAPSVPPQILVPRGVGDTTRARGVPLGAARLARRGARARARREAAAAGARAAERRARAQSETFVAETKRSRRVEALEELREALNLESLPIRIECFDISNIQGQEIVGSMVVFEDARREEGPLPQVRGARRSTDRTTSPRWPRSCSRRFARLAAGRDDRASGTSRSRATPNLVVVDGGKGQLSAALAAMQRATICRASRSSRSRSGSRRCSSRAGPSRSCCPSTRRACSSCSGSATRRTASPITFHRQRRDATARESMFDQLEGVGPARRRALLQHFGSAERVLAASARGARGRAGRSREDGAADLRPAAQGGPGLSSAGYPRNG